VIRGTPRIALGAAVLSAAACTHVAPTTRVPLGARADTARTDTAVAVSAAATRAHPGATSRRGHRFYTGKRYGSEAQFNPFSLVVTGGFDQLRTRGADKHIFRRSYGIAATSVWQSLTHPDRVVRRYGWRNWVRDELLPLSGKGGGGGQWAPNYQLHLLGGGMTTVRLEEWYLQHGASHPLLLAASTAYAWHALTELVENGDRRGDNVDAVTDLLLFDAASILLWRSERVQHLFGDVLEMTNWSGQPSLGLREATIENVHQTTMLRAPLPFTAEWRALTTFGGSFLVGVSRRAGAEHWVSVAGGWDPAENPVVDAETGRKTVILNPNAGAFWDRNGSLLASVVVRARRQELVTLNVYPGVVRVRGRSPGLWAQWLDSGRLRFGVTSGLGVGAALGPP
jgi:hypothetical protein